MGRTAQSPLADGRHVHAARSPVTVDTRSMSDTSVSTTRTTPDEEWVDPRTVTRIGVLMANGQLAPREFTTREEAEAWAQPGEDVVEWNLVCECDR